MIPLFVHLLGRPGEPPILLYVVMLQWLQVATRVFHADLEGVSSTTSGRGGYAGRVRDPAGPAALIALPWDCGSARDLWLHANERARTGELANVSFAPVRGLHRLDGRRAGVDPHRMEHAGLQQLIFPLAYLKWVALFALAITVFSGHEGKAFLVAATGIEVLLGLGGYFSDFKTVFFVLVIAALSAGVRLTWRRIVAAAICAGVALMLIVVWTGVKEKYRAYLNQGTNAQVVLVPWAERWGTWRTASRPRRQGHRAGCGGRRLPPRVRGLLCPGARVCARGASACRRRALARRRAPHSPSSCLLPGKAGLALGLRADDAIYRMAVGE